MNIATRKDTPVLPAQTQTQPPAPPTSDVERASTFRRVITTVGVQNISLIFAIAIVVAIIGIQNPLFFTVPNLKVIGTAIAIVGLLAVVQTIVIISERSTSRSAR